MNFTKMHGLGNDFIMLYGYQELPDEAGELAIRLCNRHFGIGADGLVFILPSAEADFQMRIFNSDGSEPEQCGNAIRCVAKYVYDHGLVGEQTSIQIATLGGGIQTVTIRAEAGKAAAVRVDMGEPVLNGLDIPTVLDQALVKDEAIEVDGETFRFTAVSMGNPHCVILVEDALHFDLHTWGPKLENHPLFPKRTNVEFMTVRNRNYIDMRVWERGAGPTLACGTGACATVVAAALNGISDRSATVSLAGGELLIEWDEASNRVFMTGPAAEVYSGKLSE
ncbi:diaminopimelate epimerase [Xylanibacillus composti]|uniref:Diaminopimelate epimerase n=1 Tax=Xylanibacillus composti TaxID=1572762 RepID=A0A8J4M0B4_9BACL|nr:diaminopimelate epimerase [Xylanibacillus composti]MDT9725587.1 diaminopimelate epimerase [Xylanibacillus composti]GIQ67680.1 diaminopimelate epimerase [Xylanibacillus composti]